MTRLKEKKKDKERESERERDRERDQAWEMEKWFRCTKSGSGV